MQLGHSRATATRSPAVPAQVEIWSENSISCVRQTPRKRIAGELTHLRRAEVIDRAARNGLPFVPGAAPRMLRSTE